MNKPHCENCAYFQERKFVKSPADTYGRWCDGFCSQKKRYTWFYNGCDKHEPKGGQNEVQVQGSESV